LTNISFAAGFVRALNFFSVFEVAGPASGIPPLAGRPSHPLPRNLAESFLMRAHKPSAKLIEARNTPRHPQKLAKLDICY